MRKLAALLVGVSLMMAGQAHALMFSLDGRLTGATLPGPIIGGVHTPGGPFGYIELVDNGNAIDVEVLLNTTQNVRTLSLNFLGNTAGTWSVTGGNTLTVNPNNAGYFGFFDIAANDTSPGNPLTFTLTNSLLNLDPSMFNTTNGFSTPLYAAVRATTANPLLPEGEYYGASSVVPEPGTMVLLGVGMLGLAIFGKRRMNKEA